MRRLLPSAPPPSREAAALKAFDHLTALDSIRETAVHRGVELAEDRIAGLLEFAKAGEYIANEGRRYTLEEVRSARLTDGSPVAIAQVADPLRSHDVQAIAYDESLLRTVTSYLGYAPRHVRARLVRSLPVECTLEQRRRQNQTVEFHFDVDGFNFVYASFYLLPTSASNGAHVMALGSHNRKPLRWLLSTARRTDAEIVRYYGSDSIITIEGPPGYGFIQDTSCYHKALAPRSGERLMLQIRYS
jgi:hypothetical protein